jgi:hypothetical protein
MTNPELILGTIAAGSFGLYIYNVIRKIQKNNAQYKRMEQITGIYTTMLDECKSVIDTMDVELKFKEYMLKYNKYESKPQENGYEQFMDEFEKHLFKTKLKLKK